jgi:CheY-like chemotaxis protein
VSPKIILYAEDSSADQKLFAMALGKSEDILLEFVDDGKEALQFLRKEGKFSGAPRPDLVVLDLNLPIVSGSEVLAQMRQSPALQNLPVFIFSGAKPTEQILNMCRFANLYIVKPDGLDKYFSVVKGLKEFSQNIIGFPNLTVRHAENLKRFLVSQCCQVYLPNKEGELAG